jgi:hypothetical protein
MARKPSSYCPRDDFGDNSDIGKLIEGLKRMLEERLLISSLNALCTLIYSFFAIQVTREHKPFQAKLVERRPVSILLFRSNGRDGGWGGRKDLTKDHRRDCEPVAFSSMDHGFSEGFRSTCTSLIPKPTAEQ